MVSIDTSWRVDRQVLFQKLLTSLLVNNCLACFKGKPGSLLQKQASGKSIKPQRKTKSSAPSLGE
jgi:hypothetical protein